MGPVKIPREVGPKDLEGSLVVLGQVAEPEDLQRGISEGFVSPKLSLRHEVSKLILQITHREAPGCLQHTWLSAKRFSAWLPLSSTAAI